MLICLTAASVFPRSPLISFAPHINTCPSDLVITKPKMFCLTTFFHPSSEIETPYLSSLAAASMLFCTLSAVFFNISSAKVFRFGNYNKGEIKLKNLIVS